MKKQSSGVQPSQPEGSEEGQDKSPYPSEVTYKSDKNFLVRLKALIDKNMKLSGYKTSDEKFKDLIEKFNCAEDYLFESPSPKAVQSKEEPEAVVFHKWVIDNEYEINNRAQMGHSPEQLYQIFKQEYAAQTASPVSEDDIYKKALQEIIHTTASKTYTPFQKVDRCFGVAESALSQSVSTQDPFIEKHLAIIREKMIDNLIHVHIEGMGELEKASVEHFLETGKVNGSFYLRLKEILTIAYNWNKNQPPVSTQVQGEDWKAALAWELRYDNYDQLNTDTQFVAEWMAKKLSGK